MWPLLVACAMLLLVFHFGGRWVRDRCRESDFGLFGPFDGPPRPSS